MRSKPTESFATRVRADEADLLREVLDETGLNEAELLRVAIRYYLTKNPHNIEALYPEGSIQRMFAEMGSNDA